MWPGYSTATISTATLETTAGSLVDSFYVHTNGGHYAKVLVTASISSTITLMFTIYIGGTAATILYQGSAGYPGVDQINATIPASTPNGCWIAVAAVAGGVLSNIATIPINSGGGACVDPVNGLSGSQLTLVSGTLRTGLVVISQTNKAVSSGSPTFSTNADAGFEKYTGIYTGTNPVSPGGCIVNNLTPVSPGPFRASIRARSGL